MTARLAARIAFLAAALAAPAAAEAQVRFERTGYRLTSLGQRLSVAAQVVRSGGDRVPASSIRWRMADTTVAGVTREGMLISRRAGVTRLWAVSGTDSASAIILVDQWAARFDFYPAVVRLDAVGARQPLRIRLRDAGGQLIADQSRKVAACRSVRETIASLDAAGSVTARGNGVTYVRCTDRGVADSVRVEVRQRAARALIQDKLSYGTRIVGDTFRIRLTATDPSGDEIRDVQATWASQSPLIVSIDPLTGMARAVNAGSNVKIVAQVGDATDTVSVTVLPGTGMLPVAIGDTTSGGILEAPRAPSLYLQSLFLSVGDTARVTPRDANGAPIVNPDFRIESSDSSLVTTLGGQRVVAKRSGNTYIIAQLAGIIDSALVSVREKGAALVSIGTGSPSAPFVRPRYNEDSAAAFNRARLDSASRAIQRQSVVAVPTGRLINLAVVAVHAAHATRDTNYLEQRSGILFGGEAELAPHRRIKLSGGLRTGQLSPTGMAGEDLRITEVEADVTLQPTSWFGLRGGYVIRTTSTDLATQRWSFPRASAVARLPFVGGSVTTITGLSLLPGATYSGHIDQSGQPINPDPFSLSGEAGLEVHSGRLTASLIYYVERFSFPKVNNNAEARTDQFSALRLRLGLQAGR